MRYLILITLFSTFLLTASLHAQDPLPTLKKGVKSHKKIDAIYKSFSKGYRTLTPQTVANLYTKDAAYISPRPNSGIRRGRQLILESFTRFFKNMKETGRNPVIRFTIVQRKVTKKMGYDVGIFDLKYYKDGKVVNHSMGKFVVVAVRGKDRKWRFQVDGYSELKPQNNN